MSTQCAPGMDPIVQQKQEHLGKKLRIFPQIFVYLDNHLYVVGPMIRIIEIPYLLRIVNVIFIRRENTIITMNTLSQHIAVC